jgi:hypothetical protein
MANTRETAAANDVARSCGEAFFPGDVVVGPDHAELLELCDAVLVQTAAGVEAARVGGPLPEREPGERGRPALRLHRFVLAAGDAVGEGNLEAAVEPVVEGGGFHAASRVFVFGVEDAWVDERC